MWCTSGQRECALLEDLHNYHQEGIVRLATDDFLAKDGTTEVDQSAVEAMSDITSELINDTKAVGCEVECGIVRLMLRDNIANKIKTRMSES